MKYLTSILAGITITLGGGVLVASAQGYGYDPLVTLPGVTSVGTKVGMGEYLAGMMKFIIALAGVLAILMAIIGGTQYVASGISPSAKDDAKGRIEHAFIGLTLVLVSYLLLNSINPKLVNFSLLLPPITGSAVAPVSGAPTNTQGTTVTGCSSCVITAGLFPQKASPYGCKAGNACQIDRGVAGKLINLNKKLISGNINWEATELWPPTRTHKNQCHQAGTCIDAALRSVNTAKNILAFINASSASGLRAVYEVASEDRRTTLVSNGVPASNIQNLGAWINGEHFSVYNN